MNDTIVFLAQTEAGGLQLIITSQLFVFSFLFLFDILSFATIP